MADPNKQNLEVGIKTTADTSGLKQTAEGLDAVKQAAEGAANATKQVGVSNQIPEMERKLAIEQEQARNQAELAQQKREETAVDAGLTQAEKDLAKARADNTQAAGESALAAARSKRESDQLAQSLSTLERQQKALLAIELGSRAADSLRAIKDLSGATGAFGSTLSAGASSLDTLTSGLGAFLATGNPVLGLLAGLAKGGADVVREWRAMRQAIKDADAAQKDLVGSTERLKTIRAELSRQVRSEALAELYRAEARELDIAVQKLERRNQLADAAAQASATARRVAGEEAVRRGANPNQVQAAQIAAGLAESLNQLQREIELREQQVEVLQAEATKTSSRFRELESSMGKGADDTLAAKQAAEIAAQNAEDAEYAVNTLKQVAESKRQELTTAAQGEMNQLSANVSSDVTRMTEQARDVIKQSIEEVGGKVPGDVKRSLTELEKVLSDNLPDAEQLPRIYNALILFINNTQTQNQEVYQTVKTATNQVGTLTSDYQMLRTQLDQVIRAQNNQPRAPRPIQ